MSDIDLVYPTIVQRSTNIIYNKKTNLFRLEVKGIPYTMSHKELQFLSDLIFIILRDFPNENDY